MPATGRVSVNYQMLFAILPFLCIFAAYRIKKLRMYVLIIFIASITVMAIDITGYFLSGVYFGFSAIAGIGLLVLEIYLIRRWSIEWNHKFDVEPDTNPSQVS